MKKFLFILSILFCTTVFANNSFADCPPITPNKTIDGVPVKVWDNNRQLYLVAKTFQNNNTCMAMFITKAPYSGHKVVGFVSNYPAGTSTDASNAFFTPPLELCSDSEFRQILQNPAYYFRLLTQSYEDVDLSRNYGSVIVFGLYFQRCPVTCEAGTVLWADSEDWKYCDSCPNDQCCLTEQTTYTLSDYRDLEGGNYLCPVSGGDDPTGDDPTGEEPSGGGSAPARLRMSTLTPDNADGTIIASGAYAKGAYNANVGNINTALTYVEDSSVETIKHATVSAENVSLSVAGFTPAGTIDVDSSNATVSGTVNVANTVAMLSEWGTNSTENGTLSGSQQVSITNGAVTGMTGSFSGPANGQLSGTGTLSNASIHVNNWVPVNPQ